MTSKFQAHVCFLLPKLDFFNTLVKGLKLASSILLDFLLGNKKKHLSSLELGTNKTAATQWSKLKITFGNWKKKDWFIYFLFYSFISTMHFSILENQVKNCKCLLCSQSSQQLIWVPQVRSLRGRMEPTGPTGPMGPTKVYLRSKAFCNLLESNTSLKSFT